MLSSIIIRTYNESRYLPELLREIEAQTIPSPEREVIVVDSGSTDGTLEIATQRGARIVRIEPEQFSFGRSLNLGCAAARGKHLVFISGHCVPASRDWLSGMIEPLEDGRAELAYGRQIGGPETKFSEHELLLKYFPPARSESLGKFFCNNANAAVPRTVWEELQFDESLTGLEDMAFGKRLVEAGRRIEYVPSAAVFHYHHESWRKIKRRYEREAIALQKIMPEVHVEIGDALRYFAAGVLGDWAKALARGTFCRHAPEIIAFRFCQYYGSWRGNHIHRKLSKAAKERYFYPR
jgi:glycosyltransferase involved in cell wall biosynthesis